MQIVKLPDRVSRCLNLIGGTWQEAEGASLLTIKSPYSGGEIAQVPLSNAQHVTEVVQAAARAFPAWRATPIKERAQPLFKFRELVRSELDSLSNLVAIESGKTLSEAAAGILKGLEVVEFALSLQNSAVGGALEVSRGVQCHSLREPLGVVAGICPFNFPAMVPMWMYPIAIALGNCFVLKPSEKVALTSQRIGQLMIAAGFPAGVFSIINGAQAAVEAIVDSPEIQSVGFVGSSPIARKLYARTAALGKRALCLGGAKNLVLLAPDADPNLAISGICDSFTGCAGQRCMAASLLVAIGDCDQLLAKIIEHAQQLRPGIDFGAIVDQAAHARIISLIDRAQTGGAKIVLDGRAQAAPQGFAGGNWLGATVIDHARQEMECVQTEIFGPVLTIVRVNSLSQALSLEHAHPYGNATSIFTNSGAVARTVAEQASNGMIGINIGVPVPREPFSFGGTKESKFGSGDITGMSALDLWSSIKKVTTKWSPQSDNNWMS